MKCYVHIGSTKTGSSALQRGLYENKDLNESGFCYPDVGVASAAQHLMAACLHPAAKGMHQEFFGSQSDSPSDILKRLASESIAEANSSGAHTMIISSEYLWGAFEPPFYDEWFEAFEGVQLEIIAYLRPLKQWFMSSYLQAVKSGEKRQYAEWFSSTSREMSSGANPTAVLLPWRERLGKEFLHLVKYSTAQSNDIVYDFSERFLSGALQKSDVKQINPSPDEEAIELLLEVNRSQISDSIKNKLRGMIMRDFKKKPLGKPFYIGQENEMIVSEFVAQEETRFAQEGFDLNLLKD